MIDNVLSGTYGDISWLMNNTFFFAIFDDFTLQRYKKKLVFPLLCFLF